MNAEIARVGLWNSCRSWTPTIPVLGGRHLVVRPNTTVIIRIRADLQSELLMQAGLVLRLPQCTRTPAECVALAAVPQLPEGDCTGVLGAVVGPQADHGMEFRQLVHKAWSAFHSRRLPPCEDADTSPCLHVSRGPRACAIGCSGSCASCASRRRARRAGTNAAERCTRLTHGGQNTWHFLCGSIQGAYGGMRPSWRPGGVGQARSHGPQHGRLGIESRWSLIGKTCGG